MLLQSLLLLLLLLLLLFSKGKKHVSENITVLCLNCLQRRVVLEYTGVFSERQMLRSFTKIFIHSQKWSSGKRFQSSVAQFPFSENMGSRVFFSCDPISAAKPSPTPIPPYHPPQRHRNTPPPPPCPGLAATFVSSRSQGCCSAELRTESNLCQSVGRQRCVKAVQF